MAVNAAQDRSGRGTVPKRIMPSPEQDGPWPHGLIAVGITPKYSRLWKADISQPKAARGVAYIQADKSARNTAMASIMDSGNMNER